MQIKITPEEMTRIASNIKEVSKKFEDITREVKNIVNYIDWELRSKEGIEQKLLIADTAAKNIAQDLDRMSRDLISARDKMMEAEDKAAIAARKREI